VVSGGDTFNLKADHLQLIGERLLKLPNIRRIRFARKALCVAAENPERSRLGERAIAPR